MDELEDIRGLSHRRPGCASVVAISVVTSALVSTAVVVGLRSQKIPALDRLVALVGPGATQRVGDEAHDVPQLIGLPKRAAAQVADHYGFKVDVVDELPDSEVAVGDVLEQSPGEGAKAVPGTVIKLVVSKGPNRAEVPSVVGQTLEEARGMLEAAGLRAEEVHEAGQGDGGIVTAAVPEPGQEVEKATAVVLTVTSDVADVPSVVNLPLRRARRVLVQAGLKAGAVNYQFDPKFKPNVVMGQVPEVGAKLAQGAEVTLVLNRRER